METLIRLLLVLAENTYTETVSRTSQHVQLLLITIIMFVSLVCLLSTDDNSRVVLQPMEGYTHDFVNASYVDVSFHNLLG